MMNDLKSKTLKGVLWNSFGTIGAGITSFLVTIVLARLLSPSHFGVLELMMVFVYIADTIVDSGFSQVLIADKNAGSSDYTS
uniref:oligosaccharide flippase family protein n=1 Tax=uncultured Porphyromonas sp. TaxID=159274 RepID=UPI0026156BDE